MAEVVKGRLMKPRKRRRAAPFFAAVGAALALAAFGLTQLNNRLFPLALEITALRASSAVNRAVSDALDAFAAESPYAASDFYVSSVSPEGRVTSVTVNTPLANAVCAALARDVSLKLAEAGEQRVELPLGAAFGGGIFSNSGPGVPVTVMPVGEVTADYESSFEAAGVNQARFRVWVVISCRVRAVNSLAASEFAVTRKVALVDTTYTGEVPNWYLEIRQ